MGARSCLGDGGKELSWRWGQRVVLEMGAKVVLEMGQKVCQEGQAITMECHMYVLFPSDLVVNLVGRE